MLKKIVAAFLPPVTLRVADFSITPGGRYMRDAHIYGDHNAEAYRKKVLLPLLVEGRNVVMHFDGTCGIPSAWLNEVFAHPDTRMYVNSIKFATKGYSRIYDKICVQFLYGKRPYQG